MKRKILGVIAAIMMGMGVAQVPVLAVSGVDNSLAEGALTGMGAIIKEEDLLDASCEKRFLGLRPWYGGLVIKDGGVCRVGTPKSGKMAGFVWTIVLNILADLFSAVGFLAMGYMMYGGFRYIMSQGEPGKMAAAKTTITHAVIGITISVLAAVLTNTIIKILQDALS